MARFDSAAYTRGFDDADDTIASSGLEAARLHYASFVGTSLDDSYELGWRTRMNLESERLFKDRG